VSNNFPSLIGIHGRARSGKDTAATFIHETYKNHWIEAFADPLKECASAAFGISVDHFYDALAKELTDPYWCVSPRQIAQFLGNEMFRDTLQKLLPPEFDGRGFWVRRMNALLTGQVYDSPEYDSDDTVVIPDVRFQDEYDYVISKGGIIIHLTREDIPDTVGIPGHKSEQPITFTTPERTFKCENNGTISQLHRKIAEILATQSY